MLWEVEIIPTGNDSELARVEKEYALLGLPKPEGYLLLGTTRGFLLEGALTREQVAYLSDHLLTDPLVEDWVCNPIPQDPEGKPGALHWTVLLKPGVMDPVAQSVIAASKDLEVNVDTVRTFRRYLFERDGLPEDVAGGLQKLLVNDAIEQLVIGDLNFDHLSLGHAYTFKRLTVPLRDLDDAKLETLSRENQLALNLEEMRAIQNHFRSLKRDPTDVELETLAQTWSEHCSHKTLKGKINFNGRRYNNLLKETIFSATQQIREILGEDDWCVSVFEDNAGIVRFDDQFNVCFKVETHNHPSAIEPYGGANTGVGGVIRDPMGTGLGAKPVCNTDVFCFAPPDFETAKLPPGVLPPRQVMTGVVAGVRDYGNRMGIPTVNGAVCFDPRYLGNPLVYCGTVGIIPVDACHKEPKAGDLIVVVGGRTGRDGIHGATFSSLELTSESEEISGGAVQIGNAITEKKMLDVLMLARDLKLYNAITDCGAGGFSSAIGEMGEKLGAEVHLDQAPLKYEGLSYTEIWISEAQERMVLAVPLGNWERLEHLFAGEDVEANIIGRFEDSGKLRLFFEEQEVANLSMDFLHNGRPDAIREAVWAEPSVAKEETAEIPNENFNHTILKILSSYNVCSKEWIIRQYDHEVQGGTMVKPLVGIRNDGPGDAAVITPVLGSWRGLAVGCGINPYHGDLDPYHMAACAIDEAVRNVVAVGADPSRIALLDNFCWGNTDRPEILGSLVRAAEACRDVALAYRMPFISGKDSLKNEFHSGDHHIIIPGTLLISALGQVPDVRKCVTMDLKAPGNILYLVGGTRNEMGGSHYNLIHNLSGGKVPQVDLERALTTFTNLHLAIQEGLVLSCHDLSEGGLGIAAAEMAFAGEVGVEITSLNEAAKESNAVRLFSESPSRFLVEVAPEKSDDFERCLPSLAIGKTVADPRLKIIEGYGESIVDVSLMDLKKAWQKPLAW